MLDARVLRTRPEGCGEEGYTEEECGGRGYPGVDVPVVAPQIELSRAHHMAGNEGQGYDFAGVEVPSCSVLGDDRVAHYQHAVHFVIERLDTGMADGKRVLGDYRAR